MYRSGRMGSAHREDSEVWFGLIRITAWGSVMSAPSASRLSANTVPTSCSPRWFEHLPRVTQFAGHGIAARAAPSPPP